MAPSLKQAAPNIDTNDVAELFGVKPATVRGWVRAGKLPKPAVQVGQRYRWRRDEIESLLKGGRVG